MIVIVPLRRKVLQSPAIPFAPRFPEPNKVSLEGNVTSELSPETQGEEEMKVTVTVVTRKSIAGAETSNKEDVTTTIGVGDTVDMLQFPIPLRRFSYTAYGVRIKSLLPSFAPNLM